MIILCFGGELLVVNLVIFEILELFFIDFLLDFICLLGIKFIGFKVCFLEDKIEFLLEGFLLGNIVIVFLVVVCWSELFFLLLLFVIVLFEFLLEIDFLLLLFLIRDGKVNFIFFIRMFNEWVCFISLFLGICLWGIELLSEENFIGFCFWWIVGLKLKFVLEEIWNGILNLKVLFLFILFFV